MSKIFFKPFRYLWVIALLFFDTLYYFFVQWLLLPPQGRKLENIPFQWDAVAFMVFAGFVSLYTVLLAKKILKRSVASIFSRYLFILGLSLLMFIGIVAAVMYFTEMALGMERNLNYIIGNAIIFVFHHFVISNTFIAYLYLKETGHLKHDLIRAEKAQADLKLKVLQQQMSPHFLFNNLNTLISLIKPDQTVASNFARNLSSIYRYFSVNMQEDLVRLSDELNFITHYFELMKHRFGAAFDLQISNKGINTADFLCVPMSLQIVIENVIKHNAGDRKIPLVICLSLTEVEIVIENTLRPKPTSTIDRSSGSGLKNLSERCQLIMGKPAKYHQSTHSFQVHIPLLKSIQHENIGHRG